LSFAVSSLSRYSAAPRQGHLDAAIRIFCYLKHYPEKWIKFDTNPHIPDGDLEDPAANLDPEWTDYYHGAKEEIDPKAPKPLGEKLGTTVYFDSNFAHDEVTRRSITGLITFVGNTPVAWMSKRQGAIATSTYSAELCAARLGAEEVVNIRYMLRSMGIPVTGPTIMIGDNLGSLMSVSRPGTPCKKKASSIAYHYVRECIAAGILNVSKIHTNYNLADPFTKALGKSKFWGLYRTIYNSVRRRKNS
jgi:hypothetical protein